EGQGRKSRRPRPQRLSVLRELPRTRTGFRAVFWTNPTAASFVRQDRLASGGCRHLNAGLDRTACRFYLSSVGTLQAPGISKTVPVPIPANGPRAQAARSRIMNAEPFSKSEPTARLGRIAILWRGDEAARRSAAPETSRFKAVFAALADVGVDAEPVVY